MACCEGGVRFRLYPKPPYGHPEWSPETVSVSDPRGAGGADDRIRRVAGALNTKIKTAAEDAGWLPGLLPAIGLSEARAVDLTQPEGRGPALLAQKKLSHEGKICAAVARHSSSNVRARSMLTWLIRAV
jgi:hypothetical protein